VGFLDKRREVQIDLASRRIAELTEAIEGIDEELYPTTYNELREKRKRLAFRRSDLIKKRGTVQ
jgi:hypothetical protein